MTTPTRRFWRLDLEVGVQFADRTSSVVRSWAARRFPLGLTLACLGVTLAVGCQSLNFLARDRGPEKERDKVEAPAATTWGRSEAAPSAGGRTTAASTGRPTKYSFRVAPYVFRSDFEIQRDQPLFLELAQLRDQVQRELLLPPGRSGASDGQVEVNLFETRERYERYMKANYPELPSRRAFFVAQPRTIGGVEDLLVFTYWGDRIRQDLRHELTHALLHSVIKDVPLWLDEGLAEYFELPPDRQNVNTGHLENLKRALTGPFRFDLTRLEGLTKVEDMNPAEYREAWAWVHFLLRSKPEVKTALLSYLQQLRGSRHPGALRVQLLKVLDDPEKALADHILALAAPADLTVERPAGPAPAREAAATSRPTARSVSP